MYTIDNAINLMKPKLDKIRLWVYNCNLAMVTLIYYWAKRKIQKGFWHWPDCRVWSVEYLI